MSASLLSTLNEAVESIQSCSTVCQFCGGSLPVLGFGFVPQKQVPNAFCRACYDNKKTLAIIREHFKAIDPQGGRMVCEETWARWAPSKPPQKSYQEKHFTTEVMRFLKPYADRKTGELRHHPATGEVLWEGQPWHCYRLPDEPWSKGRRYQEPRPFDLEFTAGVPIAGGKLLAEKHAVELKLRKTYHNRSGDPVTALTLPFGDIREHQWDALERVHAQGINSWGWVVVQFRSWCNHPRLSDRETWALPIDLLSYRRQHGQSSVSIEFCRQFGFRIPLVRLPGLVKLPPAPTIGREAGTLTVKHNRDAWDLSVLVGQARKQSKGAAA